MNLAFKKTGRLLLKQYFHNASSNMMLTIFSLTIKDPSPQIKHNKYPPVSTQMVKSYPIIKVKWNLQFENMNKQGELNIEIMSEAEMQKKSRIEN